MSDRDPTAGMVGLAVAVLAGCAAPLPPPVDRRAELLTLAAGEAGQIADPGDRLRRDLNLADRELDDGHAAAARPMLAAAAGTLWAAGANDLTPRVRIAGWVSVSELSRRADDRPAADAACDRAVATLRSLAVPIDRVPFAVGVAKEVRDQHGKPAAAKLLAESAGWATQLPDQPRRREALMEIADATFDCDDYPGGLSVLRADPDPAWRSDTLAMLATLPDPGLAAFLNPTEAMPTSGSSSHQLDWASHVGNGAVPYSSDWERMSKARPSTTVPVQQPVDFRSVFGNGG